TKSRLKIVKFLKNLFSTGQPLKMPTITISKSAILSNLKIDNITFEKKLFDFGIELEETITENNNEFYKLDVSANRFDLLCIEGIEKAFKYYLSNEEKEPFYNEEKIKVENSNLILEIDPAIYENKEISRPFVHCFILNDICISKIPSLIEYQEILHKNLGKNRKIMSMGLHDFSCLKFPLKYTIDKKEKITFSPLKIGSIKNEKISIQTCDQYLKKDKAFSKYITDENMTSYFIDSNNLIFSYPPVINCDETKLPSLDLIPVSAQNIKEKLPEKNIDDKKIDVFEKSAIKKTMNILVEITGTDRKAIEDTVCYLISNYCSKIVTQVNIKNNSDYNLQSVSNLLSGTTFILEIEKINQFLQTSLTRSQIIRCLNLMMHSQVENSITKKGNQITKENISINVHFARRDILGPVDIYEDVAIALTLSYFSKLKIEFNTIGQELFLSNIENKIRQEMAYMGYNEVVNLTLLSEKENSLYNSKEQSSDKNTSLIRLLNPKSTEYEVVRTGLLPGCLKFLKNNLHYPMPIKIFETGAVSFQTHGTTLSNAQCTTSLNEKLKLHTLSENTNNSNLMNQSRLIGVTAGLTDYMDDMLATINQLFYKLDIVLEIEDEKVFCYDRTVFVEKRHGVMIHPNLGHSDNKNEKYDTKSDGIILGQFGIVSPDILKAFGINIVVNVFEIDLEKIVKILSNRK
ncbi:phenylalanine-tRNA synthetase, beta subunit, partial [Pseudoloma neurophilia]